MSTKTIYVFDTEENSIIKIDKKARKKAKKIMKKRALEARILRNVDKAAEFDKYMANKIWGGTEKRPIVINLERVVDKIKVKQFNDLLSSSVLNSLNQSKKKVQEAFSGSNRKA